MLILDAHCDTITKIMEDNSSLYQNIHQTDLKRMKRLGNFVQFYAAFIEPAYCQAYAMKRAVEIIDRFYVEIERYNDEVMLCRNYNDVLSAHLYGKVAAFLSIEGGEALQGELSSLRIFYRLGVRSLCLTWNHRNEIADGVKDSLSGGGLTPFGRQVIKEMNKLRMLIDLSHISEKGFWDAMEVSNAPIIVSHSNAFNVYNHPRNLKDRQIVAVKENGGVIGINLYPRFLNGTKEANIQDIIRHIDHITSLIGAEHIGFGADFDGIENTPSGIEGVQDIEKIFEELLKLNYSEDSIKKIAGENFIRVIKEVL